MAGNLPMELTRLVGRDREVPEALRILRRARLLTLAGAGGAGKTRLALRVARESAPSFRDGVWWVDLAGLDDAALVADRIAAAVGAAESPGRPVLRVLADGLAHRRALVVLDNCEHLAEACATVADLVLRAAPDVRLLATSRAPLGVTGEVSWPVPPLALPDGSASTAAEVGRSPAVALFIERANDVVPGFALTDDNAAVVAGLCARLDGLPLAIELAAARLRVLSPAQLLDRLDHDLRLLADRGRTNVPRHRTLLATMDWSYRLLTGDERWLLRTLSVFAGGFSLDAAEAVATASGGAPADLLDVFSGLVEKSLVVVDRSGDAVRYRMLDTVRRYAAMRLAAAGADARVRDAHADVFLALARTAAPALAGPDQSAWLRRLEADHDNVTAALAWLKTCGEGARGLALAGCLGRFWWFAGHFGEGAAWIEGFLDRPDTQSRTADRAQALHALGLATFWHETSAAGIDAARRRFEAAVRIHRERGDAAALAATLRDLGGYWKGAGDAGRAREALTESITIATRLGDRGAAAAAASYLGVLAAYEGDVAGARELLERSVAVLCETGGTDETVRCRFFLACLECDAADAAAARARLEALLALDPLTALPYSGGFALDGLARLAVAEGRPRLALRMAGAAAATHERLGTSAGRAYDAYVRRGIAPARQRLHAAVAEQAFRRGRDLPFEEAVAEGLRPPPDRGRGVLSAREAEVLDLAAEGLTDGEIAGRLHLSPRTVGNHLSTIYRKLHVTGRIAAIRRVHDLA